MAINKITPRALDKATDHKLVPATAFIDAVNVVYTEDESNGGDDGGDAGVIKNLRGNTAISYHTTKDVIADGDFKIIGTTVDHKLKLVYFFVYHEILSEQGVWVYDPYGKLALPTYYAKKKRENDGILLQELDGVDPYKEHTIKCVVKGSFFNFKQNSVVQGNVVYGNTLNVPYDIAGDIVEGNRSGSIFSIKSSDRDVFEKDFHLFFTDNINEPKKICVNGCLFARAVQFESYEIEGINSEYYDLDIDKDGVVTEADYAIWDDIVGLGEVDLTSGSQWLTDSNGNQYFVENPAAIDLDGDGTFNNNDILAILGIPGYPNLQVQQPFFYSGGPSAFESYEGGYFSIPDSNLGTEIDIIKFCHACKPTPLSRPTFSFTQDESSSVNNFEKAGGFKFAYQIVYLDGSVSAISPKSDIAIPPSVIYQGDNKNVDHSVYNVCRINISDETIGQLWYNIKKIKILAQEGSGPFKIIKEIASSDFGSLSNNVSYDFKNDVIGIPVASKEENKFFDSVPQRAQAQSVVDNRLMYGNYVEGLPNHNVQAELSVEYASRAIEGFGSPIKFDYTVALDLDTDGVSNPSGSVKQKMSGFRVTIPDGKFPILDVGDKVTMRVTFTPNRNYHLYNATNSYHQSRHLGIENSDTVENLYWQTPAEAGASNIAPTATTSPVDLDQGDNDASFNAIKNNGGVASVTWKTVDSMGALPALEEVYLGTSAAHPLIIPGETLEFFIELRCISAASTADTFRASFFDMADRIMGGYGVIDSSPNTYFELVNAKGFHDIYWDLGLQNTQSVSEGDSLSKLICMIGRNLGGGVMKPGGSIILNKGKAKFGLKVAESTTESSQESDYQTDYSANRAREYKIYLDSIPNEDLEIWTAVRKWHPQSPWWFLSPEFLASVSLGTADLTTFYENSEFSLPQYAEEAPNAINLAGTISPQPIAITYGGTTEIWESAVYQSNSILDFNFAPGSYDVAGTPVANVQGEWSYMYEALKTVIGYASNKNGVGDPLPSGELRWFVTAPASQWISSLDPGSTYVNGGLFSLFDGEGGPGGSLPADTLPSDYEYPFYNSGENPIYAGLNFASSAYGNGFLFGIGFIGFYGPYFTGKIHSNSVNLGGTLNISNDVSHITAGLVRQTGSIPGATWQFGGRTVLPLVQGGAGNGVINVPSSNAKTQVVEISKIYSDPAVHTEWENKQELTMSFALKNPQIEFNSAPQFTRFSASGGVVSEDYTGRSFKSNSDHDFGIVFYDSHGRRSFVNPLGSVFVKGYSNPERGDLKGPAAINIKLTNNPPRWASKYQFVYGGNKSMSNFIQYTTNGAYTEPTNIPVESLENSGKIYVSLNLLQEHPISYAKEWGARSESGGLSLYKFSEGDKLRIISYGTEGTRSYPRNYTFDVIETVYFDPLSVESNPLVETDVTPGEELFGEFVVLRNNPSATNFTYADVSQGGSSWNQNVAFEIFSPKKTTGVDTQVYQEVGGVYDIIKTSGSSYYSIPNVKIQDGDVFFRPVACNLNKYEGSTWTDLLSEDTNGTDGVSDVQSNFGVIFLESLNASDLFKSKVESYGRFNVASENAKTVRREAGIIYSEKSNPDSDKFNYSSFNASLYPFKDLEERFGNINFMDELGGNLLVIQQDRCTVVPVSATMLSNASGQDQLIASNNVLGKEMVYAVKAGCDNNPESVVRIDTTYYFAHKSLGKVFRFISGQGVEEISDVGMSAYLRSKFKEATSYSGLSSKEDVRIVGGYDPVKEEYLITILRPKSLNVSSSDDSVIVYGCQDPDANNYDPTATRNDGSCTYDDTDAGTVACAEFSGTASINFGTVGYGGVVTSEDVGGVITIKNTGDRDLIIGDMYFTNDPNHLFLVSLAPGGNFVIPPGGSQDLIATLNANSIVSFDATLNVEFVNSTCEPSIQVNLFGEIDSNVDIDPTGVVTVNFYLGGTLIDQQFADINTGVWTLTVDQNRVLRAIENSYSGPESGSVAQLEIEILFDDTQGVEILEEDFIRVTGEIVNGIDGFEFIVNT